MVASTSSATPPGALSEPDAGARRVVVRDRALTVVLFALVLAQAATVAVNAKAISPFDEAAHFDYVVQVQRGNVPVPAGQRYSEEAIQNWACRPTDRAATLAALCGLRDSANDPRVYFGGINYEARFGPIYYGLAALGSAALDGIGVQRFTGARLVSALLYALGAALLLQVALRFAASPIAAAGLILAAASTGLSLSIGATISPDSVAFLGTAGIIASAVLARSWRSAVLLTILVAAIGGLTKPNFIVIAILGSMLLLLRGMSTDRLVVTASTSIRVLRLGAGLALPVVASAIASAGWATLAIARNRTGASVDGGISQLVQSSMDPAARVAEQLWALLRPDGGTLPGPAFTMLDTPMLRVVGLIVVFVTIGACICAWLWRLHADRRSVLVLRAVALAVPVSAVTLVAIIWMTFDGGHLVASRYGLPFLAAASVGLGASVSRRAAVAVAVFGIAAWLVAWISIVL